MEAWQSSHWQDRVVYGVDGPEPQVLLETDKLRAVLVGLEAGQSIPAHPALASVYLVIEGSGWMTVNDERVELKPGVFVTMPEGTVRGVQAETRLVFLGTREN